MIGVLDAAPASTSCCRLVLHIHAARLQLVQQRLSAGLRPSGYMGHVHCSCSVSLVADTRWRPQDLRVALPTTTTHQKPQQQQQQHSTDVQQQEQQGGREGGKEEGGKGESLQVAAAAAAGAERPAWEARLQVGSVIACEARGAVLAETGFR